MDGNYPFPCNISVMFDRDQCPGLRNLLQGFTFKSFLKRDTSTRASAVVEACVEKHTTELESPSNPVNL